VVVEIEPSELRWAEQRPGSLTWHKCPAVHSGQLVRPIYEISRALRMHTAPPQENRRLSMLILCASGCAAEEDASDVRPAEPGHAQPAA